MPPGQDHALRHSSGGTQGQRGAAWGCGVAPSASARPLGIPTTTGRCSQWGSHPFPSYISSPGGELSSGAVLAATPGCPWQQRGFGAGTGRAQPWVLLGRGLRVPGLELFLLWLSCPKSPRPRYGDPVCVGARFWGVAGGPEVLVSSHGVTGVVLLGLSIPRRGNRAAFNRC